MNPTFDIQTRDRRITFTSLYPDNAAAAASLEGRTSLSTFESSILKGALRGDLSPKQTAWLHFIASNVNAVKQPVARKPLDLAPVVQLMATALAAGKRFPRIRLAAKDGTPVVITAGRCDGVQIGDLKVTDGGRYPTNRFFGRVSNDGKFWPTGKLTAEQLFPVVEVLDALAADPVKVTGQHGVATGQCCYCGTALSTAESRSVGYGPICASKFGLPWGDTSVADAADAAAKAATYNLADSVYPRDDAGRLTGYAGD